MAYDYKESHIEMIPRDNSRGDYIRVARLTPVKGLCSIDIRNYYTDDNGEQKPTQKGIRFNSELSTDVIVAILTALNDEELDEIMDKIDDWGNRENRIDRQGGE